MDTPQLAIAFATLFVAITVPFCGAAYWIGKKLERLEGRVAAYTATLSALAQAVGGLSAIVQDEGRRIEITRALTAGLNPPPAPSNPFSDEEAAGYNRYVQMARNGEPFSEAEVRDFNALIQRYRQDHHKDPNVTGLLVLGAFLLGLYLLGRPTGQE